MASISIKATSRKNPARNHNLGWRAWAATATSTPISEAMHYLNFHLNADNRLNPYTVDGSNEASPDRGAGLVFTYRY